MRASLSKTRTRGRLIQWSLPLDNVGEIRARERRDAKKTGLLDIGRRRNWLYSRRLFPEPRLLKQAIDELLETARS